MSKQSHFLRAFSCAPIALVLAAALEGLRGILVPGFSAWQAYVAAIAACGAIAFLIATVGLPPERSEDAMVESENRYRSLFENMLEGFAYCKMIFDERGRPTDFVYLDVNVAFGKLTGLAAVVGKKFSEVIPRGKDSPELIERYGRVVLSGKPESFEIELKALGMWFSISAHDAGKGCFVATFENISERKRIEQALRQAEEKYRAIFQGAVVGIYQSTPAGRYVNVNPAMAHMLGYDSPQELVTNITDISQQVYVDPESREQMTRLLREQGMVKNFECAVHRKDGS